MGLAVEKVRMIIRRSEATIVSVASLVVSVSSVVNRTSLSP
jgi:hypothetical protein